MQLKTKLLFLILPALVLVFVGCGKKNQTSNFPAPENQTGDLATSVSLGRSVSSSAVAVSPNGRLLAAVNPDSDSITLVDVITLMVLAEILVGDDPRSLSFTPDSQKVVVACHGSAVLSVVDLNEFVEAAKYPVGYMPYGVVTDGVHAFVSEYGLGKVSVIDLKTGELVKHISVNPFPAGLALSRNGKRLFVTHFFTGRVTVIDPMFFTIQETVSAGSDTNLSQFIAITPDGKKAYLPQTRSNTTNKARLFDTTVFPIVSVLDVANLRLIASERIALDTADKPVNMPFSIALSPDGETLYLANAGSNDVSVIDLNTNRGVAHIAVGANPRGIAITPDGSRLFVNNILDGTLSVIDPKTFNTTNQVILTEIPITSQLLRGKKIFNSAAVTSLTMDNWISCATCHFDGTMDARTWLGFPDGPRNTPSLQGVGETLPIHWSGDLDELQDVEITIRDIQFGTGLVPGAAHDSLGPPFAGLSDQLDALAAYLASIEVRVPPTIGDAETISLGNSLFTSLGCNTCHVPPLYTDRKLHDVGTGDIAVEKNSHGRGTMFDTPSLRGVWQTAPYFHDGSAATLELLLSTDTVHNVSDKLDDEEVMALIVFLRSLPEGN